MDSRQQPEYLDSAKRKYVYLDRSQSAVDGLVLVLIFFLSRSLEQFYLMLFVLGIEFTSVPDIHNRVILSMRKS
ncbi:hypothetical protein QUB63_35565, partial [Microcoleus sp. ARI1-B5]|uniref:hypothetical protein n=1 Tax=unclassified Microcoleus TaxID=2642155 RepID=UPI002FCF253C